MEYDAREYDIRMGYQEDIKILKRDYEVVLRRLKDEYDAIIVKLDETAYIPGDTDVNALLVRLKEQRKARLGAWDQYQAAKNDAELEYCNRAKECRITFEEEIDDYRNNPNK